jgi:hypothetical protein
MRQIGELVFFSAQSPTKPKPNENLALPVALLAKGRDRIVKAILSAPHGHPVRRSGCSPAEPYPADGYCHPYHIPKHQLKRPASVVLGNERSWVCRFSDHAERGYLRLFLRCAIVLRLVWKKFFPRVAE